MCPFCSCFFVAELLLRVLVCAELIVAGLLSCDRQALCSLPLSFVFVSPEQAVVLWLACPPSLLIVDPEQIFVVFLFLAFALPIDKKMIRPLPDGCV